MAGRAQKGPLTIMRSLAKEANEEQKKEVGGILCML